jgi:tetratricopeptide (TPR) repeat protein
MGEDELALQAFDRALSFKITSDLRAAALNNKGLVLLRLQRLPEAIVCFEEALQNKPDLEQANQNLQRARKARDDKTENQPRMGRMENRDE